MRTRLIAVLVAAVLVAACGGDDDDSLIINHDTIPDDEDTSQGDDVGDDVGGDDAIDLDTIDAEAARAGLDAIVEAANADRADTYPAVDMDVCPLGEQTELAETAAQAADVFEATFEGSVHAWANPDGDNPGVGCWVAPFLDDGEPTGAAEVHVYARAVEPGDYDSVYGEYLGRSDTWSPVDESSEPFLGGTLHSFCWEYTGPSPFADDCGAHWEADEGGLVLELELYGSGPDSVNAADTAEALKLLLPEMAVNLASR